MKVALIHDWLVNLGGAERVLIELHRIFPEAPIYTLFCRKSFRQDFLPGAEIRTSSLQKIPLISKIYKYLFFLMPQAVESFDLSPYDVVISSSVIFSKGIIVKTKTKHICYCYSPTRFLWDRNTEYRKNGLGKIASHFLRIWDRQSAERVDKFAAISKTVQERIKKYYRRDSTIIYPPISIRPDSETRNYKLETGNYYLIVSRLYDYKNINVAIDAFNKLGFPLVIIGSGPAYRELKILAGPKIKFLGFKNDEELINYYQHCYALIMPQEEDFGLSAIEAMSFGKPVLALKRGGVTEIVIDGLNGEFFDDPIPEALADGVRRLNENFKNYQPEIIKKSVEKFSRHSFYNAIINLINDESR